MKTKLPIIAFVIVSLLAAFASFTAHAQDSTLIADETTLTYTKTGAKIVTYSGFIFDSIYRTYGSDFYSFRTKKHRVCNHISDTKYIIYVSKATGNNIKQWAKKNL